MQETDVVEVSYRKARKGKKQPSEAVKRKKTTQAELCRKWGYFGQPSNLRYANIMRGLYWYWLSLDVRKKEWEKWNGECITCLIPLATWQEGQCGHMVSSAECGEYLRFNKRNLALQHAACNNPRFNPNAGARNAVHYDMRYGPGAWDALYEERKTECKEPKTSEYPALIEALDSYKEYKATLLSEGE